MLQVIYSDEKRFTLDGPDGFRDYWRNLMHEPRYFTRRNFGGGGIMVWAAFTDKGQVGLEFTTNKTNSHEYCQILDKHLIPFLARNRHSKYTFLQDNCSIHVSAYSKAYFSQHKIAFLDWPVRSPDVNPQENVWGYMVREIYKHNTQYQTVDELKKAIEACWARVPLNFFQNLINSMPNRVFDLINKSGTFINY